MKKIAKTLICIASVFLITNGGVSWAETKGPQGRVYKSTIGINKFVDHPLLDDVIRGIQDELGSQGFKKENGTKIIVQNAAGDTNIALQINKQFIDRKVSILVPVATPAAQSAVKLTKTIPIVFGAITDPVEAGLADSLDKPGGNKTGTSDQWPYRAQMELIRQLVPKAKTIGLVFNPGESNSQASLKHIRPALEALGFKIVEVPVSNTAEVYGAVQSLVGRCDVILVPADNTVTSAFDSVVKVANENRIPLFAGNIPDVEKGAIATYGVNYYQVGRATGKLVAKILKEKANPGQIPVVRETNADLVINLKAAEKQGVTVPEELISKAARVIK